MFQRRGDFPMRIQWGWIGIIAAVVALASSIRSTEAQYSPGAPGPIGAMPYGAAQPGVPLSGSTWQTGPMSYAMYAPGGFAPQAPGPGGYGAMPVMYDPMNGGGYDVPPGAPVPYDGGMYQGPMEGMYDPGMYGEGMYGGGGYIEECPFCGGAGCRRCYGADGVLKRALSQFLPYSEGGCCAPRWFDFHVEAMILKREDVSRQVPFTSDGPRGQNPPVLLMTSDSIGFDNEPGLRFTGALQVLNEYNLEFTYFGLFNFSGQAQLDNAFNDLFSAFSDFGGDQDPGPGVVTLAYDETDNASRHRIEYSSTFDNFEFNVRKRWTGVNCRLQGSRLMGARYFWLDESFRFHSLNLDSNNLNAFRGTMTYDADASNSMTGFQIGGDLWTCIVPGISVGGELKAAIMGNRASQTTTIFSSTTNPLLGNTYREKISDTALAGLVEANLMGLYRIGPHWTLRSGYNFLYLDGVALGIENFNPTPPNTVVNNTQIRVPRINHNGDLFLHGFTFGAEYMW